MTRNQSEHFEHDPALAAWIGEAREQFQSIQYVGALAKPKPKVRRPVRSWFALAASAAAVAVVWLSFEGMAPPAPSGPTWSQPAKPTSVRDLSSLARGVRQGMRPPTEVAPRKPRQLQFRLPQRPASPDRKGFGEPAETSGIKPFDPSHVS